MTKDNLKDETANSTNTVLADSLPISFGEWLFKNAKPSCSRDNGKTNLWLLDDDTKKWNDRFKTTTELYEMFRNR